MLLEKIGDGAKNRVVAPVAQTREQAQRLGIRLQFGGPGEQGRLRNLAEHRSLADARVAKRAERGAHLAGLQPGHLGIVFERRIRPPGEANRHHALAVRARAARSAERKLTLPSHQAQHSGRVGAH